MPHLENLILLPQLPVKVREPKVVEKGKVALVHLRENQPDLPLRTQTNQAFVSSGKTPENAMERIMGSASILIRPTPKVPAAKEVAVPAKVERERAKAKGEALLPLAIEILVKSCVASTSKVIALVALLAFSIMINRPVPMLLPLLLEAASVIVVEVDRKARPKLTKIPRIFDRDGSQP